MLPDPFTVPATAPWPALVMRNKGPSSAKLNGIRRVDDTGAFESVITHDFNTKTGERHVLRLTESKDVTLPSGSVVRSSAFIAITFQAPVNGWTEAQKVAFWTGLKAFVDDAEVTFPMILRGES